MLETLASILLNKLPDFLSKLCERPKIMIEAKEFHYDLFGSEPNDSLVVITPNPSRYYARLAFSNIGRRLTTIRQINVLINGELELSASAFVPIRLEPGEFSEKVMNFPVERKDALARGTFKMQVFDAFGKRFGYKGQFPLRSRM